MTYWHGWLESRLNSTLSLTWRCGCTFKCRSDSSEISTEFKSCKLNKWSVVFLMSFQTSKKRTLELWLQPSCASHFTADWVSEEFLKNWTVSTLSNEAEIWPGVPSLSSVRSCDLKRWPESKANSLWNILDIASSLLRCVLRQLA